MHKFTKMSNITGGKLALLAAVAASATVTAHAATRNWIGGQTGVANTPESPYTIQDLANWSGSGATSSDDLSLSVTERTYIQSTNDTVRLGNAFRPNSGEFVFTGPLWNSSIKAGSVANSTVSILKKSGNWTFSSGTGVQIGDADNSTVVFTNESGNVNVTDSSAVNKIGAQASSYAKVVNQSGNWTFNGKLILADKVGSTGIVENVSGDWSVGGDLDVAQGYGKFTQYGGSLTVGGDMYISHYQSGRGVLTIKGGTVTVPSGKCVQLYAGTGTSKINLDGGTLVTPQIRRKDGNVSTTIIQVNFNGGTLKANAASSDFIYGIGTSAKVNVGANGGMIDSGNNAVTLAVGDGIKGTGGLTFTGGNTITLKCNVSYSGATRVMPGTTLAISNATAKANILGTHGLVVAGIPTAGQTIVTYTNTLTSVDYAKVSCPLRPATTYKIGDDGMSIVVDNVSGSPDGNYWTGAVDNDLSNAANWSNNEVPTENAVIYSVTNATLTKGEGFAPKSITFLAGSAAVTINGDDFTDIVAITNNSTLSHTINAKVYFSSGINVQQNAGGYSSIDKSHVTFAGGAYAASGKTIDSGYSVAMFGKYYFANTSESPWTATENDNSIRKAVADNSSLYIPYAGSLKEIYVGTGAKVDVGNLEMSEAGRLSYRNGGEVVVTNIVMTGSSDRFCTYNNSDTSPYSTFKFECVTNSMTGNWFYLTDASKASTNYVYIGAGGLNFTGTTAVYGFCGGDAAKFSGNKLVVRPWYSDFTIAEGGKSEGAVQFRQNVEFCTDDESGTGRTITINANTRGRNDASNNAPAITVSGKGTLQVNGVPPNNEKHPTVTVTDTATLAFGANGSLGTGAITLNAGTTLALTATSSTFTTFTNGVTLPTGENEKATIRLDGQRLKSGNHTILSNVAAGATAANVELDMSSPALDGRKKASLAVDDSNLVLTIAPSGLMVIFK